MIAEQAKRRRAETAGRRSETAAAILLRLKGFAILERRFKSPVGEIDIIAKRGRLVAFVEVKARSDMQTALEAVTPRARRRIVAAADAFLSRHPHLAECDCRYDIVVAAGWRLRHVSNAWRVGD
ncbi:MAG: YraN family protein [Hyphococcus sp.]